MNRSLLLSTLSLALVASGCVFQHKAKPATAISASMSDARNQWTANLVTPSELSGVAQVRGTSTWMRSENQSVAVVAITNATPGASHPWHIHAGHCGEQGPIVGAPSAYPMLKVNPDGNANTRAVVNVELPSSGDYYVNVHASAENMGTIVSCGNLAAPVK